MAKRIVAVILIALLILPFLVNLVYADDSLVDRNPDEILGIGSGSGSDSSNLWERDAAPEEYWGNVKENNGIITRIFITLFQELMEGLNSFFGLQDPVTLFFNVSPETFYDYLPEDEEERTERLERQLYVDPDNAFLYMFNDRERSIILGVMATFEKFLQIPYVLAVAIVGFLLFVRGASSSDKSAGKVLLMGILSYPILMKFFPFLFEPIFWVNDTIVRAVGSALINPNVTGIGKNALTRPFVTILMDSGTRLNSISAILASLLLFIMTGILNFQYFVRRFMLAILIMMFPIVAFLQIFPGTKSTFRLWWSEFAANLFLQAAHATIYVLFVGYIYNANLPIIPIIAMLMTLSTMSTFVRNLMGCKPGSGISGMVGGMVGFSALMGAAGVARSIFRGGRGINRYSREAPPIGERASGSGVSSGGVATAGYGGDISVEPSSGDINIGEEVAGAAAASTGGDETIDGFAGTASAPESRAGETESGIPLGEVSKTGAVWGMRPRVEPVKISHSLGRTAASVAKGAVVGGAALVGATVGGAAMGPAGVGIGAYAAVGLGAKPLIGAASRGATGIAGIVGNAMARRKVINDTMQRRGMKDKESAAVFAATGVQATKEELLYDDVLRQQYKNFMNISGLEWAHGTFLGVERELPKQAIDDIRIAAARERERFLEQNPNVSMAELNQHILDNVIRPAKETYLAKQKDVKPTNAIVPVNSFTPSNIPVYEVYSMPQQETEIKPDKYINFGPMTRDGKVSFVMYDDAKMGQQTYSSSNIVELGANDYEVIDDTASASSSGYTPTSAIVLPDSYSTPISPSPKENMNNPNASKKKVDSSYQGAYLNNQSIVQPNVNQATTRPSRETSVQGTRFGDNLNRKQGIDNNRKNIDITPKQMSLFDDIIEDESDIQDSSSSTGTSINMPPTNHIDNVTDKRDVLGGDDILGEDGRDDDIRNDDIS